METPALAAGTVVTPREPSSRGFENLSSEDFFALLIAELQSQDPLNPMDNQQFLEQMSSIRQMEQSTTLNETLKTLATQQRFGSTAGLIGHYVSGTVTDGAGSAYEIRGVVIGVRYERDGSAILELHDGSSLAVDKVEQVTLVDNLPPEILEELQRESDLPLGGDDGADDPADPAARIRAADNRARASQTGAFAQTLGQKVDTVAGLLDTVFAPRVGVGF